jgi:hypothetical protein
MDLGGATMDYSIKNKSFSMPAQTWASYNGTISQASFQILYSLNCEDLYWVSALTIAGHRHLSIRHLSPVQKPSACSAIVVFSIQVPE